ncbi:2-isopropylmalate synthase [Tyzzerella sp. OttesenSCG-928-J15]|nr:2-isopropylmalate synthase [Tyzzerella sp. OttesenSCG-928-J15]
MNNSRYFEYRPIDFTERTWPGNRITKAPIWCSVDLRDGNQALEVPMNLEKKVEFFKFLVETGFKEIEIGFPAASETEYEFARKLIEDNLIPDDVTVQVLTQAKEDIIKATFEALQGVKKAVIHLYNSTSTLQRDVVFRMDKEQIKDLAVSGAEMVLDYANKYGRERFTFQYSPESFTGTEPDYAVYVVNAVLNVWKPTKEHKVIINLPSTVEMTMPNIYADQIEYVCKNIDYRENVIVSLHAHNDRGTGVAASELGILAGADRIEGTLFGNGERTGNADIVTIAMNMYTQGVDPQLNFSNINKAIKTYEKYTLMDVHKRHPYAGELVFTAFSGSHQDAINKGMKAVESHPERWEVPYLPIDPKDLGRNYEAIIRINSQSGRGGVSYVLESKYGLVVPKMMMSIFGGKVKDESDKKDAELSAAEIHDLFFEEYVNVPKPIDLIRFEETSNGTSNVFAKVNLHGEQQEFSGAGSGLVEAFTNGISKVCGLNFEIVHYSQHATEEGVRSKAMTYIGIKVDGGNETFYGCGHSSSVSKSSIKGVISAVNKAMANSPKLSYVN